MWLPLWPDPSLSLCLSLSFTHYLALVHSLSPSITNFWIESLEKSYGPVSFCVFVYMYHDFEKKKKIIICIRNSSFTCSSAKLISLPCCFPPAAAVWESSTGFLLATTLAAPLMMNAPPCCNNKGTQRSDRAACSCFYLFIDSKQNSPNV